jgi:hypothetical protein
MNLDALLNLAEQQVQLVLIGLHQQLLPSWVLINAEGKFWIFGTPWRNDSHRCVEL